MSIRILARVVTLVALLTIAANTADAGCRHRRARQSACPTVAYAAPTTYTPAYAYATPQAAPQATADPSAFGAWLNAVRAQRGLGPVALDGQMQADAATNSSHGFGHSHMGAARRQNAGVGAIGTVQAMWLQSPGHAAALLDPSITAYGLASVGNVWTFSAR